MDWLLDVKEKQQHRERTRAFCDEMIRLMVEAGYPGQLFSVTLMPDELLEVILPHSTDTYDEREAKALVISTIFSKVALEYGIVLKTGVTFNLGMEEKV